MIGKHTALGLITALSLVSAPAAFAADTTKDIFTVDFVKEVAADLGGTNVTEPTDTDTGRKAVKFELSGLPIIGIIDGCGGTTECKGLIIVVAFKRGELAIPLNVVNEFNGKNPFVHVTLHDPDIVAIGHAMISVGGVTKENVKANVMETLSGVARFASVMNSQLTASAPVSSVVRPVVYGNGGSFRPIVPTPAQLRQIRMERLNAR